MPAKNPEVFLSVRVKPARYVVGSFSANLAHVAPPGEHDRDLIVPVKDKFISPNMEIRVRLQGVGTRVRAQLFGWSSAFEDDPETEFDERWRLVGSSPQQATSDIIEISGTFNPFLART
ncbi:MAG TPA: hypothetical protein VE093_13385 [Polyangiaceae bacterium]|nr:hypothetical protein [Polyangiaceae bacterium]